MVDPVGLISLGLTVCQSLLTYYDQYKSFSEETSKILQRLNILKDILQALHDVLADAQVVDTSTSAKSKIALRCVTDCEDGIKRLNDMLSKVMEHESGNSSRAKIFDRAMYPFRRKTLLALSSTTRELQESLDTALHLLELSLCLAARKQIVLLGETSTNIATSTKQTLALTQQIDHRHDEFNNNLVGLAHKMEQMQLVISHYETRFPDPSALQGLITQHHQIDQGIGQLKTQIEPRQRRSKRGCICFPYGQTSFGHMEGCRFYLTGKKFRGLRAKHVFCNKFLSFSVKIAFGITTGAGGFAISPHLEFQTMVANSPAFEVLKNLESNAHTIRSKQGMRSLVGAFRDALITIERVFQDRRASPTDIDVNARIIQYIGEYGFYDDGLKKVFLDIVNERVLGRMLLNSSNNQDQFPVDFFISHILARYSILPRWELDDDFFRLCQPFLDEDSYWCLGTPGGTQSGNSMKILLFENFKDYIGVEEISASEALEPLINRDFRLLKSNIEKGVEMPLFLYTLWSDGFHALLSAGYKIGGGYLDVSCSIGNIECVRNIIAAENFELNGEEMTSIASNKRHLPSDVIQDLMPKPNTLLGFQASQVYNLLKEYHVKFNDIEGKGWVVYMHIDENPIVADMLWDAGFRDIDETDSDGFTALMAMPGIHRYHDDFLDYADWLIRKGADVYFRRGNIPALHYLAYNASWYYATREVKNASESEERMLRLILEEDCQDSCHCACSTGGCYAATLFWRSDPPDKDFYAYQRQFPSLFSTFVKRRLDLTEKMMSGVLMSLNQHAIDILRVLTFDTLGIPHTCQHHEEPDHDEIQDSIDDLAFLEKLMLELIPMYEASGKDLLAFLQDEWLDQMEEVWNQPTSKEDIRRVRGLGVVLKEISSEDEEGY
ncbi:hypothetical protein N7478_012429 [Penicillium angulare]|uniref:uncharacterized protein n=1 Tax=Penicillium angulare TaxID=116970 RepID=UPI0025425CB0|nr:uncharacterized protein N7478_012429 [Penicillium angulare]KAJ5259448.1 hypothetical protein N7478_012429 [Penicillium angulare]